MACRLVGAKPLSESMLEYCWLDPEEHRNYNIFIEENAFQSVVRETAAILPRDKYVNGFTLSDMYRNVTLEPWQFHLGSIVRVTIYGIALFTMHM